MTIIVTTTVESREQNGRTVVVAKALGKQRTISWDHEKGAEGTRGAAVGTLLNALLDDRQKSMLMHPSGKQRVRVESTSDGGGRHKWTIEV